MNTNDMKNIKKPAYACEIGNGVFAALKDSDWYCKYCMQRPSSGSWCNGNYTPYGGGFCSKSPTKNHVWEHL